jgi:hypothetical protein
MKMPAGARPLESYDRYYSGICERGHKVIRGVFDLSATFSRGAPSGLQIVKTEICLSSWMAVAA